MRQFRVDLSRHAMLAEPAAGRSFVCTVALCVCAFTTFLSLRQFASNITHFFPFLTIIIIQSFVTSDHFYKSTPFCVYYLFYLRKRKRNLLNQTMKDLTSGMEVIHKDVVIIGNGPSGISLSAMLSGLVPYLKSCDHPDEMLSARLHYANPDHNLIRHQKLLEELAIGLEGRTTNPISLLLDALEHPCADLGLEIPSLIEWRRDLDHQIDHVVLGKGPPGGSWHTMDPNVLTLSLGSWMSLPGLPYTADDSTDSQRRASAGSVARYYENYVKEMHLEQFFKTGVNIISVERINNQNTTTTTPKKVDTIIQKKDHEDRRKCSFVSALNFIRSRTKCHKQQQKKEQFQICAIPRTCKRPRDHRDHRGEPLSPNRKIRDLLDRKYLSEDLFYCDEQTLLPNTYSTIQSMTTTPANNRSKLRSLSFSCDSDFEKTKLNCDTNQKHNSLLNINECQYCQSQKQNEQMEVLCECSIDSTDSTVSTENSTKIPQNARWLITGYDNTTGKQIHYSCANLVLANGASDLPNRLGLPAETFDLPWVLHNLRSLETKLDQFVAESNARNPDPVLVIGAGLSAADAVIATRFRNIPVIHVFRNRSVSLDKQLPENFYPEYHKVHQMMLDGGSTYPLYTSLPEHSVTDINAANKTVTLVSKQGILHEHKVSFVVILIGSRPNLNFLPGNYSLGVNKQLPIDAKQNPIDINTLSHSVNGHEGLYAIGPLAGDHFVRFIPGGALAVVSALNQH